MSWIWAVKFFLKLALICGLAVFLTVYPGTITAQWLGYKIDAPIFVLLATIFALTGCFIFFHHLWIKIWQIPEQYYNFLKKRRQVKGEKLLIESLTAIAAHQPEEAQSCIELAKVLIPSNPLTLFVAAQSAHIAKNDNTAVKYFELMMKDHNLKFLGLRGLIIHAQKQQNWIQAEKLLKQALTLRPDSPWLQQAVLKNQLHLAQISNLEEISTDDVQRYLPKNQWQRHQAIRLWLQLLKSDDQSTDKLKSYQKIVDLAPEVSAFSQKLAEIWIKENNFSKAQKVLTQSYKLNPHRDMAKTWILTLPEASTLEIYQSLEKLTSHNSSHPESLWILAEAAIKANLWGEARKHIENLLKISQSQSVYRLRAELEEAEYPHNFEKIKKWYHKASVSPQCEKWICQQCHNEPLKWDVICQPCEALDSIEWHGLVKTDLLQKPILLLEKK